MHPLGTALLVLAIAVPADKCRVSADPGTSANGTYKAVPTTEYAFEWQVRKADGSYETRHTGQLVDQGHPHLHTFVLDDGSGFIVANPSGGLQHENRFVLYSPQGKTLRSIGLADFLNADQLKDLHESVSHIHAFRELKLSEPLRALRVGSIWGTYAIHFPSGRVLDGKALAGAVADYLDQADRAIDAETLSKGVARLNADDVKERDAAQAEIAKMGWRAAEPLRKAAGLTAEQKGRVETLLARFACAESWNASGLAKSPETLQEVESGASLDDGTRIRAHLK